MSVEAATQILDILIDNAHTHGGGAVTVYARALGHAVAVDVSDEGRGLTLEPHQLFAGRDSARAGGIGLPFARKLAEVEHARVTLTSAEPPTFSFVANRADTAADDTADADADQSSTLSGRGELPEAVEQRWTPGAHWCPPG